MAPAADTCTSSLARSLTSAADSNATDFAASTSSLPKVDRRALSSVCRDSPSETTEIGPSAMADSDSEDLSRMFSAETPTESSASTARVLVTTFVAPCTSMSTLSPAFRVKSVVTIAADSLANTSSVSPTRTVASMAFARKCSAPKPISGARMPALRPAWTSSAAWELRPREDSE